MQHRTMMEQDMDMSANNAHILVARESQARQGVFLRAEGVRRGLNNGGSIVFA